MKDLNKCITDGYIISILWSFKRFSEQEFLERHLRDYGYVLINAV